MSQTALNPPRPSVWNVPNLVTIARVLLALVLFVLMARSEFTAALGVFLVAAGTDWVDGYWARKYGQVTQLGRILDPFADKLIVCGTFIYLAAGPQLDGGMPASGVAAWVAVLIMAREMIVTALRSFVESRGGDFSAKTVGKWKMVFQCAAAAFGIGKLQYYDAATHSLEASLPTWIEYGQAGTLWIAIILTIWSGIGYMLAAGKMVRDAD
ncbi:MAG TPA: CDP-diacylglycerol--glycerol-3-phosphate 3-phosphatidyltransferase [Lacipirellulaceae bacterium]|nr:CDP-diacylglycerol--glycerol-3-phosphate 3-phosphatidyltransferase [Lacipirellulaceae bacterium]